VVLAGITACVTLVLFWQLDRWFPDRHCHRPILPAGGVIRGDFGGTIGRLTGAAGAVWAAFHHQGLAAMALWIAGGNVLQAFLLLIEWYRRPELRPIRVTDIHRDSAREFIHFCYAMFATQLAPF
jgi:hypothetical protein